MTQMLKSFLGDLRLHWKQPGNGNYVAYKEYLLLSVGWFGMRLATAFGIAFGVNDPFTAMTLHLTHRDLLILGYVCTAIGYVLAPFNAWLIDNLHRKEGKYRVFAKLAVPSGILSLFALFFPYEKLGYLPMVLSLFLIGQIQGYIKQWYTTGVSNLVYVISPNSDERVKIMTVSSLIHNFAPTILGLLIPVLSDVLANGDLYNIRTYRLVYPVFIVVGTGLSLAAYYGVSERIVAPRARPSGVGILEALTAVSGNKLFWIKSSDNWNNFMEDSKNVLMQWVFYYGKAGSMTLFGVMDTLSYNSAMWAMLASPGLIRLLGKRGFKIAKNISQVFITLGLALTYKKSLWLIFVFFFLNRFWETTEVIDRAIESDIRDYQQYISGERIDGAFGVVDAYVGGAVGAVTNLFIPWVYKRNGFDGTDYSVLHVYDDNGVYRPDNVLYTLLDKLMWISLAGAVIDVFPWFLYDLKESDQKGVTEVLRLRAAVEDFAAGYADETQIRDAMGILEKTRRMHGMPRREIPKKSGYATRAEHRKEVKAAKKENEEIEIAAFVQREFDRYATDFGNSLLDLCRAITENAPTQTLLALSAALPKGRTKEERVLRADARRLAKRAAANDAPGSDFDDEAYDRLFDLPEDTKEERQEKTRRIREASKARRAAARTEKPVRWARRHLLLSEAYADIDAFFTVKE